MKFYSAGMFSLVLVPMMLIPVFYLSFQEMNNRILKFNIPSTNLNAEDRFSIYHLYENVFLDSFLLDTMNFISIGQEFDKLACLSSDSLFLSRNPKVLKKGIMFRMSSKSNYESLINLINQSEKHNLKYYGLDIKNDNFVVIHEFERQNEEPLGFFCGYKNDNIITEISKIKKIQNFIIEKWAMFSANSSFQFVLLAYLILIMLCFLINV